MKFSAADMQFMRTAMEQAERGQFTVAPNPLVGCVIVSADGRIIGQGWHTAFGQAHAEVEAYQSVSPADQPLLAESTWYVTLEPCNHVGQTPACAALIERISPKRVVIGVRDSNPAVAGGGIERLRAAGIQV
ncbi:MAG: bifunctional diaminohydroxyphosphoribosylaminopyrimidine deaminase/5-amino-6-(5-phosphoribosylamino)uracil reductase RibD, partial [Flavobacteriales bacterium]